jgi:hypothetical protein
MNETKINGRININVMLSTLAEKIFIFLLNLPSLAHQTAEIYKGAKSGGREMSPPELH